MEININDFRAEIIPDEDLVIDKKYALVNQSPIREEATKILQGEIEELAINLDKVERIDSCFISDLIWLKIQSNHHDIKLVLKNINSEYIYKVLKMTKMEDIIDIRP